MTFEELVFYFFSAILVFAATMVVFIKKPVHAALYLVLAFFSSAGVWLLLDAEFLAVTLVLVYVGAVMVLFLFVVMMLDINLSPLREGFARYLPAGLLIGLVVLAELAYVYGQDYFGPERFPNPGHHPEGYSNTAELGSRLYTEYFLGFELAAVILLVAILAAIALTLRPKRMSKYVRPEEQVVITRKGRVKLVDPKTNKTEG